MNKKILIGSIIAICILIGVSFTSVVGYRTVDSDVKASPLSNIRSSRAIDGESEDFSCEYVGKGEENTIILPSPDGSKTLIREFTDIITKMDDKVFTIFLTNIIKRFNYKGKISDENRREIILSLQYIKKNPEGLTEYLKNINNEPEDKCLLKPQDYTLYENWKPRCLIEFMVEVLDRILSTALALVLLIVTLFMDCFETLMGPDCGMCFRPQSK